MKILMLCPLLSSSSMITVYPMAKALSRKHEIKLIGPLMGGEIFVKGGLLDVEVVEPPVPKPAQAAMLSLYPRNLIRLMKEDFDVVHAFKLLPHTAPAASMVKRLRHKKFVLSIDDYDAAASRNIIKRLVMKWAERSYRNADAITVSSTRLQEIYGGEVIYQVPNETLFKEKSKTNAAAAKRKLGIEGKTMVLYAGTFYEHKGLDILIRAVQRLGRDDIMLVLAGDGATGQKLKSIAGKETIFTGRLPMEKVAELTAAADIYAVPTKDTEYARAEIPGKIFEPMMLGKAIIASRISDIPEILGHGSCGILSTPGDVESLARSIRYLADNPKEARRFGAMARARYEGKYCMELLGKSMESVYSRL